MDVNERVNRRVRVKREAFEKECTDLDFMQWLQRLQEEMISSVLCIEKLQQVVEWNLAIARTDHREAYSVLQHKDKDHAAERDEICDEAFCRGKVHALEQLMKHWVNLVQVKS